MKTTRLWFVRFALLLVSLLGGSAFARADHIRYRWDFIKVIPTGPRAGGVASALADDGSKLTLTGSGTFIPGLRQDVTGGGTWILRNSRGDITDSGTYVVTGLVTWHLAPGGFAPTVPDEIGRPADSRSGYAVLRVAYSNGSRGLLVVSCAAPGAPATVFEGITASMDFANFWKREAPVGMVEGNRPLFHVLPGAPATTSVGGAARPGQDAIAALESREMLAIDTRTAWRWDIISLRLPSLFSGGVASALANDGSKLTLTGSGAFVPGVADEVAGGGTWIRRNPRGEIIGSGTYVVTELVSWHLASGTLPATLLDQLGNAPDRRAGLAALRVAYSNGSQGRLVVSCQLAGTPGTVFEGITASMDFVDFWNREAATDGVDANRPLFHAPLSTPRAPAISRGGVVNAATNAAGPLAPNAIIAIYGENLAAITGLAQVGDGRIGNTLSGVRVNIGAQTAPLFYVSPAQINTLAPIGLPAGSTDVTVSFDNMTSAVERVTLGPAGPGIFVFADGVSAVTTRPDGSLVGRFSGATPARAGETISVYGTGFGGTSPAVSTGEVFPGQAPILQPAEVRIGTTTVTPEYIGGAPGFAGLFQINLRVPMLSPGDYDVVVTIGGLSSRAGVKLAVQ